MKIQFMKTQFKFISYLFITLLFFSSCSTEELELNEQETISLEAKSKKISATVPGCVQHAFFPAITQEYNVSSFGYCTVSFNIGNLITAIPSGSSNIKYIIQVVEGPLDHPDGVVDGPQVIHNFVFNSDEDITNDSFDILYRHFGDDAPVPTFGFITDQYKRLKVSFGVFNQGIGSLCTPFKPENVFFTTTDDCPW